MSNYSLHLYSAVKRDVIQKMEDNNVFAVFLLEGESGALGASRAKKLSPEDLLQASQNALELSRSRQRYASKNHGVEGQIIVLEEEIYAQLDRVEKTGNLKKTIEARNKLSLLQGESVTGTGELLRLRRLLKTAEHYPPTAGEEALRRELVTLLREAAEKTSPALLPIPQQTRKNTSGNSSRKDSHNSPPSR